MRLLFSYFTITTIFKPAPAASGFMVTASKHQIRALDLIRYKNVLFITALVDFFKNNVFYLIYFVTALYFVNIPDLYVLIATQSS